MKNLDRYPALKSIIISNEKKRAEAHCYDQWVKGLEALKQGLQDIQVAEQMVVTEEYVPQDIREHLIARTQEIDHCVRDLEVAVMNLRSFDKPN